MRRMETAVRQQKNTATLAKAAGDTQLERRCKGTILQLNEKYKSVADQAGLKPEFQRTFVQGFRDVESAEALTGRTGSDIMLSDSGDGLIAITREAIESVPQFTEFASPEANEAVRKACVELLDDLINDPVSTEETISLPLSRLKEYLRGELNTSDLKRKGGQGDESGKVRAVILDEPFISLHNHPSGETLTLSDTNILIQVINCRGVVVIGNNGRNTYSLLKGESFDFLNFAMEKIKRSRNKSSYNSDVEFYLGAKEYGALYTERKH